MGYSVTNKMTGCCLLNQELLEYIYIVNGIGEHARVTWNIFSNKILVSTKESTKQNNKIIVTELTNSIKS